MPRRSSTTISPCRCQGVQSKPDVAEENNCCLALLLPYCGNRHPRVKTLPPSLLLWSLLWKPHAIVALQERSRTGVSSPYFGVLLPNWVLVEERRGPSPLRCRQVGDQWRKGGQLASAAAVRRLKDCCQAPVSCQGESRHDIMLRPCR